MKYCSEVLKIGSKVDELKAGNMLILFCQEAPEMLYEFCVIHKNEWPETSFSVGDNFALGNSIYEITAIGKLAIKYMNELGHVTLCFDGAKDPKLDGYIHLKGEEIYVPVKGEEIVIY